MNKGFKIKTVTCFISEDTDGTEGVMAAMSGGVWTPLVCADEARIASVIDVAKEISATSGIPFRVVQFTIRIDVTDDILKKFGTSEKG